MVLLSGNFCIYVLTIVVSFLVLVVGFFKRSFTFWEKKGVCTIPPSIPFGNAANLIFQKEALGVEIKKSYDEFKKRGLRYGGFYFFSKPIFIPVDLDLIKSIMTKDFAHFTDRIFYMDSETEPITGHLVFLKGSKWKQLRTKLNPSFTPAKIKMMFETLLDCTKGLVAIADDAAKKNRAFDTAEVISRFMMDVTGSCAFGIECNSLKNGDAEFLRYGKKFFDTSLWDSFVRLLSLMGPDILHYAKFRTVKKDVARFFYNVVQETVTYREKNKIVRNDFLQVLIQLKDDVKKGDFNTKKINKMTLTSNDCKPNTDTHETSLTLEDLAAQCFAFFMAGYETSATTTTYCLCELARNTEIQDKLREEIHVVLARHEGQITYDSLMEMTYMEKCVAETLRKYPSIPILTRECTQTYKVPDSNVVIDKGTFVLISALAIHHDPEFYTDPEKFDPERFSEAIKASRHPFSWIPFGDGPRICIALKLGIVQVKVALAALLKDYKFTLNSKTPSRLGIAPKISFILIPEEKIFLDVEKAVKV